MQAASLWRFGTAQPRPLLSPRPRQVACPAIAPPKGDNHLATQVPPVFDYGDNCDNPARAGAGVAGELSKLTEELQGLMSELESTPVAQWQPTADGNYVLSVSRRCWCLPAGACRLRAAPPHAALHAAPWRAAGAASPPERAALGRC
jgi:hypothetical protein